MNNPELMARRAVRVTKHADATISYVVDNFDYLVDYATRTLEKLERCRRAHGHAQVRIDVLGPAECPNYLIEYIPDDERSGQKSILWMLHIVAAHIANSPPDIARRLEAGLPKEWASLPIWH